MNPTYFDETLEETGETEDYTLKQCTSKACTKTAHNS